MLKLVRRITLAAAGSADAIWAHAANSSSDWSTRGFVLQEDGEYGFRVPVGSRSRLAALYVMAETDHAELAGEGAATISIAAVERIQRQNVRTDTAEDTFRQRAPVDMAAGDLVGEFDLSPHALRLFPRITTAIAGVVGSPSHVSFYMGVM